MKYDTYLASGWFNEAQAAGLNRMKAHCTIFPLKVYSPKDECLCPADAPSDFAKYVLQTNKEAIVDSGFVYANPCGRDMGTLFEIGYAMAMGKHVALYDCHTEAYTETKAAMPEVKSLVLGDMDYIVCDTSNKSPLELMCAGYAHALGIPIVYYCEGLPPTAKFNLMLAKTASAVCTDEFDLAVVIQAMNQDSSYVREYCGLIE